MNHAWSGGPLTLLHEYVAGVAPTSPGYATYQVKPRLGGLARAESAFDTVRGRIRVRTTAGGGGLHLELDSPLRHQGIGLHTCCGIRIAECAGPRSRGMEWWHACRTRAGARGGAGHDRARDIRGRPRKMDFRCPVMRLTDGSCLHRKVDL